MAAWSGRHTFRPAHAGVLDHQAAQCWRRRAVYVALAALSAVNVQLSLNPFLPSPLRLHAAWTRCLLPRQPCMLVLACVACLYACMRLFSCDSISGNVPHAAPPCLFGGAPCLGVPLCMPRLRCSAESPGRTKMIWRKNPKLARKPITKPQSTDRYIAMAAQLHKQASKGCIRMRGEPSAHKNDLAENKNQTCKETHHKTTEHISLHSYGCTAA